MFFGQECSPLPSNLRQLRTFGLVAGAVLSLSFGLIFPTLRNIDLPLWPWVIAGILWICSLAVPAALRPVHRFSAWLGSLLGIINRWVLLSLVFYFVLTPIGLITRWVFRRNELKREFEPQLPSYRVPSRLRSRESMEKPF